jgi:hypothetical protein
VNRYYLVEISNPFAEVTLNMICAECGATFFPRRYDQRFCCTQHKNNYHQRLFDQRAYDNRKRLVTSSSELQRVQRENERLQTIIIAKDAEIKQFEQLSDKLNGEVEQIALRPIPNITIHRHSAPTAGQARYFASIGARQTAKEFKRRFSNLTRGRD